MATGWHFRVLPTIASFGFCLQAWAVQFPCQEHEPEASWCTDCNARIKSIWGNYTAIETYQKCYAGHENADAAAKQQALIAQEAERQKQVDAQRAEEAKQAEARAAAQRAEDDERRQRLDEATAAVERQQAENAKMQADKKAKCGDDYKHPTVGMAIERAQECVAPFKLVGQALGIDGRLVSTYEYCRGAHCIAASVIEGHIAAWSQF